MITTILSHEIHYFLRPAFTMDAAFKFSGASIDLIHDKEIYDFLEKCKRGGVTR